MNATRYSLLVTLLLCFFLQFFAIVFARQVRFGPPPYRFGPYLFSTTTTTAFMAF